jgi:hypothetical protein
MSIGSKGSVSRRVTLGVVLIIVIGFGVWFSIISKNTSNAALYDKPTFTLSSGETITNAILADYVEGYTVLDPTLVLDKHKIAEVTRIDYYANQKLIHSTKQKPFYLDSTLVADGTYTLRTVVTFADGSVQEQSQTTQIKNGESGHGAAGYSNKDGHTPQKSQ